MVFRTLLSASAQHYRKQAGMCSKMELELRRGVNVDDPREIQNVRLLAGLASLMFRETQQLNHLKKHLADSKDVNGLWAAFSEKDALMLMDMWLNLDGGSLKQSWPRNEEHARELNQNMYQILATLIDSDCREPTSEEVGWASVLAQLEFTKGNEEFAGTCRMVRAIVFLAAQTNYYRRQQSLIATLARADAALRGPNGLHGMAASSQPALSQGPVPSQPCLSQHPVASPPGATIPVHNMTADAIIGQATTECFNVAAAPASIRPVVTTGFGPGQATPSTSSDAADSKMTAAAGTQMRGSDPQVACAVTSNSMVPPYPGASAGASNTNQAAATAPGCAPRLTFGLAVVAAMAQTQAARLQFGSTPDSGTPAAAAGKVLDPSTQGSPAISSLVLPCGVGITTGALPANRSTPAACDGSMVNINPVLLGTTGAVPQPVPRMVPLPTAAQAAGLHFSSIPASSTPPAANDKVLHLSAPQFGDNNLQPPAAVQVSRGQKRRAGFEDAALAASIAADQQCGSPEHLMRAANKLKQRGGHKKTHVAAMQGPVLPAVSQQPDHCQDSGGSDEECQTPLKKKRNTGAKPRTNQGGQADGKLPTATNGVANNLDDIFNWQTFQMAQGSDGELLADPFQFDFNAAAHPTAPATVAGVLDENWGLPAGWDTNCHVADFNDWLADLQD